jgi:hypothetical protein
MKKFNPKSPDEALIKGADMSLAKFGHLNTIVDAINKTNTVSGSGATVILREEQSTSVILADRAAGIVFTLPSAKVGLRYTFIVSTSVTSNSFKVITASASQFLQGTVVMGLEATTPGANPGPKLFSGDGSTHVAIAQNGSTTGGLKGTRIVVECISSTLWSVSGTVLGSGTIATPFATS